MKPILIIAPYSELLANIEKILINYNDVDVKLGLLNQAAALARQAIQQGVEVIISRGGTARKIEASVPEVPVVEIPVSPYDILYAIHDAKKYGRNILVLGFKNIIHGVAQLGPILDINIKSHLIEDQNDGECYLRQLIEAGEKIDVVLGGTVAENLARHFNIPTVFLKTSPEVIYSSINDARKLLEVARKEKEKTERFKAVLHYINEGIISVDHEGKISTFNPAAAKITNISDDKAIGRSASELFPELNLSETIHQNRVELGQLLPIGKTQVLAKKIPILIGSQTVGAVATFEDITKIQEYEQKIRTELSAKGYIAKYRFEDIIGESDCLKQAKRKALKYATSDSTVLIIGESGTGKEMFAQSIHLASKRRQGPFVAVNCAALPQNLLESELFGYEEGAFTGASKKGKLGLFAQAHGGTIFLDEIGEISPELQVRLLRVLQEREIRPLGSDKIIPVDVRIISATNKKLLSEVEANRFRQDLYYRLNILKLTIPSLAERSEDIKLLSNHFLMQLAAKCGKEITITDPALNKLQAYHWPGNIRELENILERLVILAEHVITEQDVQSILEDDDQTFSFSSDDSLEEIKKRHILNVLSVCEDNQTLAAEKLGISRTHLWRLIKKYRQGI